MSHAFATGTLDNDGPRAASSPAASFITGSDILMDGGVTASYWYGELAPAERQ